jgi:8-oxo-dGTP pyrophosphatase MutT (NUDIX family)
VDFFEKLHKELLKPLPGVEIQLEMSAGNRVFYKEFKIVDDPKESSVLIVLYPEVSYLNTIFIKRTTDKGPHSGQMAFPGGMYEPEDKSLYETALREAEEEVGIDSNQVNFLGKLTPLHIPVSNVIVNPFIVTLPSRPDLTANTSEVEEIFETPIDIFLDKKTLSYFTFEYKEKIYKAPSFIIGKYIIWGATAMIWNEFLTIYKKTL